MPTTLDGLTLNLSLTGTVNKTLLPSGVATDSIAYVFKKAFTSGVGVDQADRIWHDQRTIVPSGTDDLDLAGVLTDALNVVTTFVRIKGIIIVAADANVNDVVVGNAASNQFLTWVGAATHTVKIKPGGLLALFTRDATAYAVTAATADMLRIANGGAGTSVLYDIFLIGASA